MMSNQSQRMRKNISPGAATKQGPMRATVPLSLMHQTCSPTKCLKGSPSKSPPVSWSSDANRVKTRLSPDNRISPETHTTSMGCRVEQPKSVTKTSPGPYIRRTASVDTIYLLGQWQRDALYLSYCGRLMMDRATQTPDEFEETDRKFLQKRCGSTCGETLEMKFIRQRLQRTSHSPRLMGSPSSSHQRQSPLPGDHFVISSSTACGGGTSSPTLPSTSPHLLQQGAPHVTTGNNNTGATYSSFASSSSSRALPIPIPDIPKPLIPRMRSSVEGLNQEIERIVLRQVAYFEGDDSFQKREATPEGHRAPIADLFRHTQSVDTQTPFDYSDGYLSSNSSNSGSQSVSPAVPIILGHMDSSRPSSAEENKGSPDIETTPKLASSPHINKFLTREPPDGCEKVKIAEETRNSSAREMSEYSCPKPSMNFVLLPSRRSAFYPLCKNCGMSTPNGDLMKSGTPPASERF